MKQLLIIIISLGYSQLFSQGTWTQKANFQRSSRSCAVSFNIGTKGYVATGISWEGIGFTNNGSDYWLNDLWEYDPTNDTWTKKTNFPGTGRAFAVGFSIGDKGYIGGGTEPDTTTGGIHSKNDFWEYNPATDTWTQKANIQGGCIQAVGFSTNTKGYILMGYPIPFNPVVPDLWEYNPANDIWTKKADFGGNPTYDEVAISINNKGFVATGEVYPIDTWEYDPTNDVWTQRANFIGTPRDEATGFSIECMGYIACGTQNQSAYFNDLWAYDQITNSWSQKQSYPGSGRGTPISFSIGNKGYVGLGTDSLAYNDFWEYTPDKICDNAIYEFNLGNFISIYPNPFSIETIIKINKNIKDASLIIYNMFGQKEKEINNISGQEILLHRDNLTNGIYFIRLTQDNKNIVTDKIIITD